MNITSYVDLNESLSFSVRSAAIPVIVAEGAVDDIYRSVNVSIWGSGYVMFVIEQLMYGDWPVYRVKFYWDRLHLSVDGRLVNVSRICLRICHTRVRVL